MSINRSPRSSHRSRRSTFVDSAAQKVSSSGKGEVLSRVYVGASVTVATRPQEAESPSRETLLKKVVVSSPDDTRDDSSSNATIEDTDARDSMTFDALIEARASAVDTPATIEQHRVTFVKGKVYSTVSEASAAGEVHRPDSQRSDATEVTEAWTLCAEQVWKREELLVKKWKDEISNLLTFTTKAGLFSAALTAFNVQYYVNLQPQPLDPNTLAMLIMIGTLAQMNDGTDAMQPMIAALNASSYTPVPAHVISTNVLWFSALVLSLSAASLAISVSQWLHHHVDRAPSQSRQSVRLWYFRHSMFNEWNKRWLHTSNWRDIDDMSVRIQQENTAEALDMLAEADATVMDDALLKSAVRPCLLEVSPVAPVLPVFYRILEHRAQDVDNLTDPPTFTWSTGEQDAAANAILRETCADLLVKYLPEITGEEYRVIPLLRVFTSMIRAAPLDVSRKIMDISLQSVARQCLQKESSVASVLPVLCQVLECRAQGVDISTNPPTLIWSTNEQDVAANTVLREICIDLLAKHTQEIGSGEFMGVALLRNLMSMIKAAPTDVARTIVDISLMESVIRPCLLQAPSAEPVLPTLYQVLEYRAQGVDTSAELPTLTWSTDEQDAAEITFLRDTCIHLFEKYVREIGNGEFKEITLLHHLASLIKSMPPDAAITISCQIMETFRACDSRRTTWEEHQRLWGILPVAAMGHLSLEVFTRITSEVNDTAELHRQQMQIIDITHRLVQNIPPDGLAVFHDLISLLPAAELSRKVLDNFVGIIWHVGWKLRLDVEDTRRLVAFLPHARERLNTKGFLQITASTLRHCARLSPDDSSRLRYDVCGALNVFVQYFSSSRIEKKIRTDAWWEFSQLLSACIELARVDNARRTRDGTLFTQDVVNALEHYASRCPEHPIHTYLLKDLMDGIHRISAYPSNSNATHTVTEATVGTAPASQEDVVETWRKHPRTVDVESNPM
ncbi:hypothetical protein POSPLADRAFT_1159492 [Postia placenta MAD-698-R-SB12]|uniref:DUF6535 domain-containing protein n=1 Tax=Postia placenta MAD-698-R-SB12 TaxID=670580 RepID=A0A1X6MJS9_9APHY|nr:hypothetical protein POSPLADRAFT_1159492 [Postia placenta MAD-698-R-SB12]OSX56569.1 hypothetical protein POSPLADRAFT_1159492 [Postia placenta MAD-698-R-SB12]